MDNNTEEFRTFGQRRKNGVRTIDHSQKPVLYFKSSQDIEDGYYDFTIENFRFYQSKISKIAEDRNPIIFTYTCENYHYIEDLDRVKGVLNGSL